MLRISVFASMRGPSEHKFHLAKLQTFYFRVLNENRGRGGPLPRALSAHPFDFSLEGGLDGVPLRVTFPPSHPLARRDVPVALARGVRDRALHEHRRASSLPSHAPSPSKSQTGFIPDRRGQMKSHRIDL